MLTINVRTSPEQAVAYFHKEFRNGDYYSQDGTTPGRWFGKGAEMFGLAGEIDEKAYENLCYNRTPDGKDALTPITRENRRVAYDFTFNAPKSVSLAHLLEDDPAVLEAFRDAVRETMTAVERDMRTRVRKGGADYDRVTGNLIAAEFVHTTSRPIKGIPDPHLHAHVVVINATWDAEEGMRKACQFGELKAEAKYYQTMFHSALSKGLADRGYTIERRGEGWEVGGINRQVIDAFSRRTKQIEDEAKRRGIVDPKIKADLGRRTRERKDNTLPRETVRASWRQTASEAGYTGVNREGSKNAITAKGAVEFALAKGFERASVLTERQVLTAAMIRGYGTLSLAEIQNYFENRPGLIHRVVEGHGLVTSQEILAQEKFCLDYARNGLNMLAPLKPGEHVFANAKMSQEQKNATLHLLHSTDRVTMVNGAAGTGKTTLLQEAIPAIQATGTNVVMLAPSVDASRRVLRNDGFLEADTMARFLVDPAMQHRAKNGVICLDEAGLASVPMLSKLFTVAREANARVFLIGDTGQHTAVERGDGMRQLESEAGIKPAQVRGIQRQQSPEYRAAVQHLADGQTLKGFEGLKKMGAVIEIDDTATRMKALANEYVRGIDLGKTVLVIAPTHAEGRTVNEYLRERLREDGKITGGDRRIERLQRLEWTKAEKMDTDRYEKGQVIQFQRATVGFRAGERAIVTGVSRNGEVEVQRENGAVRALNAKAANSYSVFEKRAIEIAVGDKIRITDKGMADRLADHKNPAQQRPPARWPHKTKAAINKGRVLTIAGFTKDGNIQTAEGFTLKRDFGHFTHGYVSTSHASQGSTSKWVLIAESSQSLGAANRAQFYVSASRAKEQIRVFTDSNAKLQQAITRSAARQSATALTQQPLTLAMAEHHRIRRQHEEANYGRVQLEIRSRDRRVQQATSPQRILERGRGR